MEMWVGWADKRITVKEEESGKDKGERVRKMRLTKKRRKSRA